METRLEKNKRMKRHNRVKKAKRFCILILLSVLVFGLTVVNQNIVELNYLENPVILKFDFATRQLDIFGKTYVIDLSIFKENQ